MNSMAMKVNVKVRRYLECNIEYINRGYRRWGVF
jgi:hypothetical protein